MVLQVADETSQILCVIARSKLDTAEGRGAREVTDSLNSILVILAY